MNPPSSSSSLSLSSLDLLGRSLGLLSPQCLQRNVTTQLLRNLENAPGVHFDASSGSASALSGTPPLIATLRDDLRNKERNGARDAVGSDKGQIAVAHSAGVNALVVDEFEGRLMLSGGAEASIFLWDLQRGELGRDEDVGDKEIFVNRPVGAVKKSSMSPRTGITHLSFYPFDSLAFLSSSYDHTLKVYATETLTPSASFHLSSVIYSHAMSPIADHLLVACATQHAAIRLVDLRSGASLQSLTGHQGAVLSVAWSPQDEHILASGGSDGTVRLWDVRRSAGCLGVLDLEDSVGIGGEDGRGKHARLRGHGKAHVGACNGVRWTDDGKHLVTIGHDERVRVWDIGVGANILAHFGPIIQNMHSSTLLPVLPPSHLAPAGTSIMIYPNEKELLIFDLFEGTLLKRLRVARPAFSQPVQVAGQRNTKSRITTLAWRTGSMEMFSGHSDGIIRAWMPRSRGEAEDEDGMREDENGQEEARKRKREALDEVFRDLTKQKITFT